MAELRFTLHDQQLAIANSKARFKICAAGRRSGKTFYAAISLLVEGLKNEKDGYSLADKLVFYVSPTFDQSKRVIWDLIKRLGGYGTKDSVIESVLENQGVIRLVNGRKIELKGSDKPDMLRGVGLSYLVLDEYAFMKPDVWEQILAPTLTDVEGNALFIGTPDGRNHFYDLYKAAETDPEWENFTFTSMQNPTLNKKEIERARGRLSKSNFKQEYEAAFDATEGIVFDENQFKYMDEEPPEGTWYIAVDPAGFADIESSTVSRLKNLDECAIACVKVGAYGWYVGDVIHGRWGTRKTATMILRAAQKYRAFQIGIEKGSLKNAIMPFLQDEMSRIGTYPKIVEVTHGGQKKTERIVWALEGRFDHGRLWFSNSPNIKDLEKQLLDFPNPLCRDDLIDALAYIDQIATTDYDPEEEDEEDWEEGICLSTGY